MPLIDYLEQTDIRMLNSQNILDAEGIKKITELTSKQLILLMKYKEKRKKLLNSRT